MGSTFQQDENKSIVIYVATAPPSSEEGKRSNPSKASEWFLKSYSLHNIRVTPLVYIAYILEDIYLTIYLYFRDLFYFSEVIMRPLCHLSLQPVDYENKRLYTLKVEGSNPHIDPQFLAWGPYKDEATIKVHTLKYA